MENLSLTVAIGASVGGFIKNISRAGRSVKQMGFDIDKLKDKRLDIDRYRDLGSSIQKSKHKIADMVAEHAKLTAEIKGGGRVTMSQITKQKKLSREIGDTKREVEKKKNELNELTASMKKNGISVDNLDKEYDKLGRSVKDLEVKQNLKLEKQQFGKDLRAERESILNDAFSLGALAMTVSAPVNLSIDKQEWMNEIGKNVKGLDTEKDVKQMELAVRGIATESILSAQAVARLASEAGKIGMGKDEALEFANVAGKMAVAFDLTEDQAGSSITKIISTMGLSIDEVSELGDAINHVGDNTGSNAAEITKIIQRNGGLIRSTTGLAANEIAALSGAFGAAAPNTEAGATAQKNFVLALTSGSSATAAQQKALEQLGFSAEGMASRMQNDAKGAIQDLLSSLSALDDNQRSAVMSDMFGKESVAPIAGLVSNLSELEKTFGLVSDEASYAGSMQGELNRKNSTAAASIAKLKNNLTELGYIIGDAFLPVLNKSVSALKFFMSIAQDTLNKMPLFSKAFVVGATALLAFKTGALAGRVAANLYKESINAIKSTMYLTGKAYAVLSSKQTYLTAKTWLATVAIKAQNIALKFGGWVKASTLMSVYRAKTVTVTAVTKGLTAAQRMLNFAILSSPIGWVVGGIAALAAGIVYAYKKFDVFRSFINSTWERIKSFGAGIKNLAGIIWQYHPANLLMIGFDRMREFISSINLFESGKKILSTLTAGIKSTLSAPIDAVKGAFGKMREFLPFSDAKKGPLSDLTASGSSILSTIAAGMEKKAGVLPVILSKAFTAIEKAGLDIETPLSAVFNKNVTEERKYSNTEEHISRHTEELKEKHIEEQQSVSPRSLPLAVPPSRGHGASFTVNYSPHITVSGTAEKEDITAALIESEGRLKGVLPELIRKLIAEMEIDTERRSYA
ncbi:phage tail tape measure protein [Limisalsivibrio acetivorans]|uniref:phage tail tape measure protein n=1 Tax=Limisalsivibrio acetivorans TaxID=1304888 RepID=UPI0003B73CF5|nr:phage tail tape measure protein [Limisalsivibrio acetivorans]